MWEAYTWSKIDFPGKTFLSQKIMWSFWLFDKDEDNVTDEDVLNDDDEDELTEVHESEPKEYPQGGGEEVHREVGIREKDPGESRSVIHLWLSPKKEKIIS